MQRLQGSISRPNWSLILTCYHSNIRGGYLLYTAILSASAVLPLETSRAAW